MHRGSIVELGTTVRRFIPETVLEQHSDQGRQADSEKALRFNSGQAVA